MPKSKGPQQFQLRQPVEAMQVAQPFNAVAAWCGGTIVKHGVKFAYIDIDNGPTVPVQRCRPGDYIVRILPGVDQFTRWSEDLFEKTYVRNEES